MFKKIPKGRVRAPSTRDHSYDPETGTLSVTFHHGKTYRYQNVPKEVADGFRDAESKGSFLHANIIGRYQTEN